MKKRIISLLLSLVLLLSAVNFWHVEAEAFSDPYPLPELTGIKPLDIANIALSQLGYTEDPGTCYGNWWNGKGNMNGDYTNLDWCAMFACWCANHAGLGYGQAYNQAGAGAAALADWYKGNATYDNKFATDPQPGDIMFFGTRWGTVRHATVVVDYDPQTRLVTIVGGNQKPKGASSSTPASVTVDYVTWAKGSSRQAKEQYVIAYGRSIYSNNPNCAHQYSEWKTVFPASKEAKGYEVQECSLCGDQKIRAVTHDYIAVVTPSTCTEAGYTTYTCRLCGASFTDDYVAAQHSGEWVVLEEPSYTNAGLRQRICTVCNETETQEIAMLKLPFTDVAAGSWYEASVRYVCTQELMNGISSTQFSPGGTASRAMLVTILWRLEGSPVEAEVSHTFTDVTQSWYKDAVNWGYENKIVTGITDAQFAPDQNVTRQQAAAMLYRYWLVTGNDVSPDADLSVFPDADKLQAYAVEPMAWAVSEGLINGVAYDSCDLLEPNSNTTRAQLATILTRLCEKIEQ